MACIYGPNERQEGFLLEAISQMLTTKDTDVLRRSDFNVVPDALMDRSVQRYGQTGAYSVGFRHWLQEVGLTDVWRTCNPTQREYTFFSASHQTYSRLDHFLVTPSPLHAITQTTIGVAALSDHAPTTLQFTVPARDGALGCGDSTPSFLVMQRCTRRQET
ncbi:hypothetical protein NDU88_000556 [Pleurodeles waltl]|uniref:Endonuclease/exonuclease/phosphatase domain-containing protein n=1 Tax=Pleurodeles waltl TaxID=8319 RepID=A0AAV7R4I5_PLEWA|nr:hypothetical protein NDU88_000556 [Pleurodeles waltl]